MDNKVLIKKLKRRVAELEAEVEQLKGELTSPQQVGVVSKATHSAAPHWLGQQNTRLTD